jgi:hypothetical protein
MLAAYDFAAFDQVDEGAASSQSGACGLSRPRETANLRVSTGFSRRLGGLVQLGAEGHLGNQINRTAGLLG